MKFPISLRVSLSASMVGLALVVALVALVVHAALTVSVTVELAAARAGSIAQQASLLAGRASAATANDPGSAIRRDRALRSLFESSLAGDPTLFDAGVFDSKGRALAHSQPDRIGAVQPRRESLDQLARSGLFSQVFQLLGRPRTYDEIVRLKVAGREFGEARVGVSSALLRAEFMSALSAGLWVMGVALLLAILMALVLADFLTKRLRTVALGLERLREGEFGYRLAVEGRDELALLASSINALGERLESTRARAAAGEADPSELLVATGQMAAWAKVASGLAHELADPLNAAALHLGQLRRKWTHPAPEAARHLAVLESELRRLEQIVLGFRRFSMLGEMRAEWFDLRALLLEVVERARETLDPRRVDLRFEHDAAPERYHGDASLIRQALANLIANADQAMPGGGRITLGARSSEAGLELSVSDEGVGIPEELQHRVFDLYFTTKEDGSGIGLAVVQQVVQLHGGQIRMTSARGEGTEITMCLPVRAREVVHAA